MNIQFEDTLLPKNILQTNLSSNFFLIFNKNFNAELIISKLDTISNEVHFDRNIDKYTRLLHNIISNNERRICATLNVLSLFSSFTKSDILLLSYTTVDDKNYINGFVLIDILNLKFTFEILYICSDSNYKYIGKNIIIFLKILSKTIIGNESQIILKSIANTNTQNFYRSQHFTFFPEIQVLFNSRYNYLWKYDANDLEDIYDMEQFILPFQIVKNTTNKSSQREPGLIEQPHIFRPYQKSSSIIYEKGGKRRKKSKKHSKKHNKKHNKTSKKHILKNKNN